MGIFCLSFGSDRATEFHSSKASLYPQHYSVPTAAEGAGGGGRGGGAADAGNKSDHLSSPEETDPGPGWGPLGWGHEHPGAFSGLGS